MVNISALPRPKFPMGSKFPVNRAAGGSCSLEGNKPVGLGIEAAIMFPGRHADLIQAHLLKRDV